jgi:hypothetical protein
VRYVTLQVGQVLQVDEDSLMLLLLHYVRPGALAGLVYSKRPSRHFLQKNRNPLATFLLHPRVWHLV